MPTQSSAIPLVAKSNDGRPTKIEGNALHPDSNGGTDRFAQASILNLYDPDRATHFTNGGANAPAEGAIDFLSQLARQAQGNGGQGLSFLLERNNSPSRLRLQKLISSKLPQARWYAYEPVDLDIHRRAASPGFWPVRQAVLPVRSSRRDCLARLRFPRLGGGRAQPYPAFRQPAGGGTTRGLAQPALRGREPDERDGLQRGPSAAGAQQRRGAGGGGSGGGDSQAGRHQRPGGVWASRRGGPEMD